jgi:hypothetical protein
MEFDDGNIAAITELFLSWAAGHLTPERDEIKNRE